MKPARTTSYAAPAADKLLDLVEFLAEKTRPYGVSELAATLGISTNAVFRIMTRLVERGYACQDAASKGYLLTPRLFALSSARQDQRRLRELARGHLERLSAACGETTQIHIPAGRRVEVLDVVTPQSDFYLQVTIGAKLYYHANAFGKAILAFMPEAEVMALLPEELPRLTAHTITRRETLLEDLRKVRQNCLAYDREEYTQGVYCIGAAVFDAAGRAAAGIGITGLKVRFERQRNRELEKAVLAAALKITQELGGVMPVRPAAQSRDGRLAQRSGTDADALSARMDSRESQTKTAAADKPSEKL